MSEEAIDHRAEEIGHPEIAQPCIEDLPEEEVE